MLCPSDRLHAAVTSAARDLCSPRQSLPVQTSARGRTQRDNRTTYFRNGADQDKWEKCRTGIGILLFLHLLHRDPLPAPLGARTERIDSSVLDLLEHTQRPSFAVVRTYLL